MRTTVTIDGELVNELMHYSRTKTKTAAVNLAIKEQIRREKLKLLSSRLGSINIDEDAIKRNLAAEEKPGGGSGSVSIGNR